MRQVFPVEAEVVPQDLAQQISANQRTVYTPFSEELIAFGDVLSQKLFQDPATGDSPDLSALAFFLRAASLRNLQKSLFLALPENCISMPRGRVFHIAPANVEVMFVYSWMLSLLCGNSNIVRIPSRPSPSIETLCRCARDALLSFPEIGESQIGVAYEASSEVTRILSDLADVRVIWGGDETVANIRALPGRADLREVVFANKFSWAAINSRYFLDLSDPLKAELAARFFNDAYTFDQLACSSPRIVLFVGDESHCVEAHAAFMEQLQKVVSTRGYLVDPALMMQKLSLAALSASRHERTSLGQLSPELVSLVAPFSEDMRSSDCGGGFFFVVFSRSLDFLASVASYRDQTLAHAGFSDCEIYEAVNAIRGRGFDRVVPIGQALNFEPIWDGMNLFLEFSRTVRCIVKGERG